MEAQKLAALRNRENQRRSRARRKDYIQELEQRLRQYEIAGVKATAEIQAAARKVSEENIGLRSLLRIYGVDNGRIGEYLRTGAASFVSKELGQGMRKMDYSLSKERRASTPGSGRLCMRTPPALETDVDSRGTQYLSRTPQSTIPVHSNTMALVPATPHDPKPAQAVDIEYTEASTRPAIAADVVDFPLAPAAFEFLIPNDQDRESCDRDEISCLAAAEIIAGMRGHDNPEEVWPELGCSSSRRCTVKNMAIFQIMDQ